MTSRHPAAALLFLGLALSAADAQPVTVVTFTQQGAAIPLSAQEQSEIAERVRSLIVGCAINSVSEPRLFSERTLAREWQETRAGSHLYVRFPEPLQSMRSAVRVSEVAIGFSDPNFIGPELSRDGEEVVGHVKCSGHRALALMCATVVRPHLSPGQRSSCAVFDRIGEAK
jgi:hypothetical protein